MLRKLARYCARNAGLQGRSLMARLAKVASSYSYSSSLISESEEEEHSQTSGPARSAKTRDHAAETLVVLQENFLYLDDIAFGGASF